MKNWVYLLFITFYFISSCGNRTNPVKSKRISKDEKNETFKLALITLQIKKTESGYDFFIPASKIVEASEKNVDTNPEIWNENDFLCYVLDRNKKIMDTLVLVQPLNPRFEFPGENGAIGSQVLKLKETEVLLRFKYKTSMKFLRIERVLMNRKSEMLKIIELPKTD